MSPRINNQNRKSLFIFILLIIIIMGTGICSISRIVNRTINNLYTSNLQEISEHDSNHIERCLTNYWNTIDYTIEDVRNWYNFDNSDVLKLLSANSYFIPNIHRLSLLAEDGTLYKSSGAIENNPGLLDYCKNNPKRHIAQSSSIDFFTFNEGKKEIIVFVTPIDPFVAEGHTFKYCICSILNTGLEREFMIPSFDGEGWSCIINEEGDFIVHISKGESFLENTNIFDILNAEKIKDFESIPELQERLKQNSKALAFKTTLQSDKSQEPEEIYILFAPVPNTDWILISVTPTSLYRKQRYRIMSIVDSLLLIIVLVFSAIIGFVLLQRKKQQNISKQMFARFCKDYTSVYLVNSKDDTYKVLKRTDYLKKNYPQELHFTASIDSYIEKDVFSSDRELVKIATRSEYILKRLKTEESFSIRYRDTSGKKQSPRWYEMTATRVEGDSRLFLLGFADNNDKVVKDFMQEKMFGTYISIYYVDLKNNSYRALKTSETTDIMDRMTDISWSEAATIFINSYCSEKSRELLLANIADINKLQKDIQTENHLEYMYRWHKGNKIWRRISIHAFEFDENQVSSVIIGISMLDDYASERQELSMQLQTALDKAEAASRAKTMFLNSMSHDIRTPMNAILGFTTLAQKNIDDKEKALDSLDKVKISGEHLLQLINDVLDMSRIESGKVQINTEPADLQQTINEIYTICNNLAVSKNINFSMTYANMQNNFVLLDKLHFNQILINVISNAIKYTDNKGKVNFTIEQQESKDTDYAYYSFTIKDNGIGMSKEFLEHLFETFSREENSEVNKREGTGLGLAITKNLVDLMGGTITAKSQKGKGSTFVITLPFKIQTEKQLKTSVHESTKKINFKGAHILLVDDNDFNREIASESLEDEGLIVDEAANGAEAVEIVKKAGENFYSCILMDIQMPVMNGYEATKKIRRLGGAFKTLPIIALSANAFAEDIEKSTASGMSAHLSKPIKFFELMETLQKLL